jgi:hypothetical protein
MVSVDAGQTGQSFLRQTREFPPTAQDKSKSRGEWVHETIAPVRPLALYTQLCGIRLWSLECSSILAPGKYLPLRAV